MVRSIIIFDINTILIYPEINYVEIIRDQYVDADMDISIWID